jgi:hypothetical protein
MPVEFGKTNQAVFGQSKLTKRIRQGFWVTARVDDDTLWEIIEKVCNDFPKKKALLGPRGMMVFRARDTKQRTIGFGTITKRGSMVPDWTLGLGGTSPVWRLGVVHGKVISGKVEQVREMEFFLNELEAALQAKDPEEAAVNFVAS